MHDARTFYNDRYKQLDLRKSQAYAESTMKHDSVRTSLDIPAPLHRKLHEAAARRGCSARQLILGYMERLVAEELPREPRRVSLPLVPAAGRGVIADVSNDEALFG